MAIQKLKYYRAGFLLISLFVAFEGCSTQIAQNPKMNLKIKLHDENVWLNLMPGNNSTFHFTGKLNIENSGEDTIKSLALTELDIYRDSLLVYKLKPVFVNIDNGGDFNLPPKVGRQFKFGLPDAVRIKKEISDALPVNVRFVFTSEGKEFIYQFKNIKVKKVY